jgi:GMP synthase (glutamine-hydrolysing)
MKHEKIIILDFGGQYAHLIASRIRHENVLAEIYNPDDPKLLESLENIRGIIFSGGPQNISEESTLRCDPQIFEKNIPILGICFGHQFVNHFFGGKIVSAKMKEFGPTEVEITSKGCPLFKNIPSKSVFWMSHSDEVGTMGEGFESVARTKIGRNAAVWNREKNIFGIQFHPEVTHSVFGNLVLKNFLDICKIQRDWTIEKFLEENEKRLCAQIGDKNIFLFVSGGVDSTVAFAMLTKILGADRVRGCFVDTGLLREREVEFVETNLRKLGANLTVLRESETFLERLKGISDPEKKREIIGHTFLDVQSKFFKKEKIGDDWILGQGTIYPDTIETGGTKNSAKIKTHHNRAPEVQKLINEGKIIEPLAELYKDEVRELGRLLNLPAELVDRHPFPGPGLGVRILGVSQNIEKQINDRDWIDNLLILPIKSVGVQGDSRTYRHPAILREESFKIEKLEEIAVEKINESSEINRVIFPLGQNFENPISSITVRKSFVAPERVKILQKADDIVDKNLREMNLYNKAWQFPVVSIPVVFNKVGQESIILRPIDSIDAMSASVAQLPKEFFDKCAQEILQDKSISAVFIDITSKPPGTIEWE